MNLTDAVIRQIETTFKHIAAEKFAIDAAITRLEAEGFRIVDGGSTSPDEWEYTDWRSGEVLAAGDRNEGKGDVDWPDNWFHIDRVHDDIPLGPEPVLGLPEWLTDAIVEAVENDADKTRAWMNALRRDEAASREPGRVICHRAETSA
jgi:hypothetical protein